jgi:pimeloyl-ACP methyl ester carboxylesterase
LKNSISLKVLLLLNIVAVSFANPPQPILFVHGINSDAKMWGQVPLNGSVQHVGRSHLFKNGCKSDVNVVLYGDCITGTQRWSHYCDDGWTDDGEQCVQYWTTGLNLASSYKPGSTADLFATAFACSRTSADINHNGLYFYNSLNDKGEYAPFAALDENYDTYYGAYGQTYQLNERIKEVLNDYYGSSWQTDPLKQILIVAHSQGGLISRNLFRVYSNASVSNPVNHVKKIVTIGTPHTGSQWARNNPTVPVLKSIKATGLRLNNIANRIFDWLPFISNPVSPITTGFLNGSAYLDGTRPYLTTLNAARYPTNSYSGQKIPITVLYATAPGLGARIQNTALSEIYNSCIDGGISQGLTAVDAGLAYLDYKIDWFQVSGCGTGPSSIICQRSKCTKLAYDAMDPITPTLQTLDATWSPYSDFIVETSSQKWDDLNPKPMGFRQKRVTNPIVPHSTILSYPGEGAQSQDLLNAALVDETAVILAPVLSLLY